MAKDLTNKFFDINKLPPEEGILVFPISMSRISNIQSAKKCWEYLQIFSPNKVIKPLIGLNFIYADYLYFNSNEAASKLKEKFTQLVSNHKNELIRILSRNQMYIAKAFSYTVWNQSYLDCKEFTTYLGELGKIYKKDKKFQKYLKEDIKIAGKKLDVNQIKFFLEEILLSYLIVKGKVRLHNDYVQGHEKWILWCYPGKPLRSQIYLSQKNFFKLENAKNVYESAFYDLTNKKLYDFDRMDIDKFDFGS